MTSEASTLLFLGNTKPFSQRKNLISDFYLDKFNLLDYGQEKGDYFPLFDPDSRVEKYINAEMPELPEGFILAGHGDVSRDSCGEIRGVRATKQNPKSTIELMYNSCNKSSCPVCIRKASGVKAKNILRKIKAYQRFLFSEGVNLVHFVPKHYTLNPNYVDKHGVFHENFIPDFSSIKNYHKSVKEFIKLYITPYLDASVVFYHHHRFKDALKTELKEMGHFHVIGFGYMPKYEIFQKKFGFIYTNEGYLNTRADIYRVARYELTHVIFPQKHIKRHSIMTESEFAYRKKEKDFVDWLLHIEFNELTREQVKESIHSYHSYFYTGNLSPYKTRYKKCKKTNRCPNGQKRVILKRMMRDMDTNNVFREIIAGITFGFLTKDGRYKYYTRDEAIERKLKVNKDIIIKLDSKYIVWGKFFKTKSYFDIIFSIKNFKLKNK
ncbi:hypothetical protein ES702_06955 [subsurface metagenome]